MKLALAAIGCGLVWILVGCGGGSEAPAGTGNNAAGPFAPSQVAGPFAPSQAAGPFAPVTDPGPFAPVTDPGSLGAQPGATTTPAEACAALCARAESLGCPAADCASGCLAEVARIPEACHAAYASYISCYAANGTCDQDGGSPASCGAVLSAVRDCVQQNVTVQPRDGGP